MHEAQYPQHSDNSYLLDVESAAELTRLINQAEATTRSMKSLLPPEDLDLQAMHAVLDLGCGPGHWVLEVARRSPLTRVIGIDVSEKMIEYANAQAMAMQADNADFRVANVTKLPLDFPDTSFDLINARFIASFMKAPSWLPLLEECFRLLKPGGTMILTEGELTITNSQALETLTGWIGQAMLNAQLGFSPSGRTVSTTPMLGYFLKKAGFQSIQQQAYALDASYGAEHYAAWLEDWHMILEMLKPQIRRFNVSEEFIMNVERQLLVEMQQEDFRTISYLLSVWGSKP